MQKNLSPTLLILALLIGACSADNSKPVYVAQTGNDDTGTGTITQPFQSVEKALSQVKPGETVYLRGGRYPAVQARINVQATAAKPVIVASYPGEKAVLEGKTGVTKGDCNISNHGNAVIHIDRSSHVKIQNLEISSSPGCGINLTDSDSVTVSGNKIHSTWSRGLGGSGSNLTFEKNEVFNCVLQNENESTTSFWSGGIATWSRTNGTPSQNVTWKENWVHDCWGEGLSALLVEGAHIEGNRVGDNYSVNIYVDHSRDVKILNNTSYVTDNRHMRTDQMTNAYGLSMASEYYPQTSNIPLERVQISGNLFQGMHYGIVYWRDSRNQSFNNTYRDISITGNTLKGIVDIPILFKPVPGGYEAPSRNTMTGNTVKTSRAGQTVVLGNPSGWTTN